ncbi:MAG: hypothetical protein LIP18_05940, partial [Planctomycetes bacterium]|nr:hypothetical protein [Planctomycetota bacterium]
MLRHLVDLLQAVRDLADADRLLVGRFGDFLEQFRHLAGDGDDLPEDASSMIVQGGALFPLGNRV